MPCDARPATSNIPQVTNIFKHFTRPSPLPSRAGPESRAPWAGVMLPSRGGRHDKEGSWPLQRDVQGDGAPVLQDEAAFGGKFDPSERLPKPGPGGEL